MKNIKKEIASEIVKLIAKDIYKNTKEFEQVKADILKDFFSNNSVNNLTIINDIKLESKTEEINKDEKKEYIVEETQKNDEQKESINFNYDFNKLPYNLSNVLKSKINKNCKRNGSEISVEDYNKIPNFTENRPVNLRISQEDKAKGIQAQKEFFEKTKIPEELCKILYYSSDKKSRKKNSTKRKTLIEKISKKN